MLLLLKRKAKNLLFFSVVIILVMFYVLQNFSLEKGQRINLQEEEKQNVQPEVPVQDVIVVSPANEDKYIKIIEETPSSTKKSVILNNIAVPRESSSKNVFFFHGNDGYTANAREMCPKNIELQPSDAGNADILFHLMNVPPRTQKGSKRNYVLVYAMESEPHSGGAETWKNADFRMWYNLDKSYPEPATYFDVRIFLADLLAPPRVLFEDKEKSAPLVWILSNCHAFNGRQVYVGKLMKQIGVDSYGGCLRNKNTHTSVRMHGNIELYAKYKFVISIENSNCEDYVTEKLVHAVASGSIPIVAGKDGKPDYLRFMPKGSYINIYDYKSPEELAKHLEKVATSKEEYEKYIKFKLNHNYTRDYLRGLPLQNIIELSKTIIDPSEKFFSELVAKEKSENKLCKIARYIKSKSAEDLEAEIELKRANRPSVAEACLKSNNLADDF